MALIQMRTADGSTIGNPPTGDFFIFIDSNNANQYTLRDSSGTDTILGGGSVGTLFGLYSQTSPGPTINTLTEQSIVGTGVGSLTLPANTFVVGDAYHAKIGGRINATGGGGRSEIIIRVKNGATVLATTGIFDLDTATSQGWECELDFTIAGVGATGSIVTNGNFAYTRDGSRQVFGYIFQDNQTIDTTVSNTLDITVEWNVLNAGDDIFAANFVLFKTY
jgi:hypothetical protein